MSKPRRLKKIAIVVGTRPNFIKITQFEKAFSAYPAEFDYKLIHTGQHYDENMSRVFFDELQLKAPDMYLSVEQKSPTEQIGHIMDKLGAFFREWEPDLVVVVGDVNSTLAAAIAANKTGKRLAHLESGLRSGDRNMPEEINRILTDQIADHFFITEESGLTHLRKEIRHEAGFHFVGNTMIDTLVAFEPFVEKSTILEDHGLTPRQYVLGTIHRPSNVDTLQPLREVVAIVKSLAERVRVVLPLHPRTRNRLQRHGLWESLAQIDGLTLLPPVGYLDFQKLVKESALVVTDSGGIQEETTFRQIPCLTIRKNTERPVTLTLGTNELVPLNSGIIADRARQILNGDQKQGRIPPLWDGRATERIVAIIRDIFAAE